MAGSHPYPTAWHEVPFDTSLHRQVERWEELMGRHLAARAAAASRAEGDIDSARHGDAAPLTAEESVELLAQGALIARRVRTTYLVDVALRAGVTWGQAARAVGEDERSLREEYRAWAEHERQVRRQLAHVETSSASGIGMTDQEYREAIERAAD